MGKEGKYDLKLAEPPPAAQPATEDSDTEDDTGECWASSLVQWKSIYYTTTHVFYCILPFHVDLWVNLKLHLKMQEM